MSEKKDQMSAVPQVSATGCPEQSPGTPPSAPTQRGHTRGILSLRQPWRAALGAQRLDPISVFWAPTPHHCFHQKQGLQISFHSNN